MTTPRQPRWYSGAFILITVSEDRASDYQHPWVSVMKQWDTSGANRGAMLRGSRMPADLVNPHINSERLLSFEFQQNVGRAFASRAEDPAPAWLNLREDAFTGRSYAGKVVDDITLARGHVRMGDLSKRLVDVERALVRLQRRRAEMGEREMVWGCEVSNLVCALQSAWKLPVLYVVHRPGPKAPVAFLDPDLSILDTAHRLLRIDERERERAEAAQTQPT